MKRWARHLHIRVGALNGGCAKGPAVRRREAFGSVARTDGNAGATRRWHFRTNVVDRQGNAPVRAAASRDRAGAERAFRKQQHEP